MGPIWAPYGPHMGPHMVPIWGPYWAPYGAHGAPWAPISPYYPLGPRVASHQHFHHLNKREPAIYIYIYIYIDILYKDDAMNTIRRGPCWIVRSPESGHIWCLIGLSESMQSNIYFNYNLCFWIIYLWVWDFGVCVVRFALGVDLWLAIYELLVLDPIFEFW